MYTSQNCQIWQCQLRCRRENLCPAFAISAITSWYNQKRGKNSHIISHTSMGSLLHGKWGNVTYKLMKLWQVSCKWKAPHKRLQFRAEFILNCAYWEISTAIQSSSCVFYSHQHLCLIYHLTPHLWLPPFVLYFIHLITVIQTWKCGDFSINWKNKQ